MHRIFLNKRKNALLINFAYVLDLRSREIRLIKSEEVMFQYQPRQRFTIFLKERQSMYIYFRIFMIKMNWFRKEKYDTQTKQNAKRRNATNWFTFTDKEETFKRNLELTLKKILF